MEKAVIASNLKNKWHAVAVASAVFSLLAYFFHTHSLATRVVAAMNAPEPARTWKVAVPGNGDPWGIAYGSGVDFPQFAALYPKSGYFRLVCKTTWGTSIVLTPSFWSGGMLTQGMPLDARWHVDGDRLMIDATAFRNGLKVTLKVALSPPGDGRITAEINGRSEGTIALDARPGEAFKPVMLSSMRVAADGGGAVSKKWDARSVKVDDRPPVGFDDSVQHSDFFIATTPRTSARRFGLVGGKSDWQKGEPAPTVEIQLDGPLSVAGYRTMSRDPNDDNLGFWAATDTVAASWHYTVTASRPSD
jgi:hypothetical protein